MSDKQQALQLLNTLPKDERSICNGAVVLFNRNNSKRWQARIRRSSGEWVVYSTKCSDFDQATAVAEERYREIQYAQKTGKIDVTRRLHIPVASDHRFRCKVDHLFRSKLDQLFRCKLDH
jgi:hypothetical protein